MRSLVVPLALAALAASGCGGSADGAHAVRTPAHRVSDAAAFDLHAKRSHVSFVVPRDGAGSGHTIRVKVRLRNFVIDCNAVGKAPRPGRGHLHFVLDGGRYDYPRYSGPNGRLGKSLGVAGEYSPSLTPGITYRHIPPGQHDLEVYLANNNHTSTGVQADTKVVVR